MNKLKASSLLQASCFMNECPFQKFENGEVGNRLRADAEQKKHGQLSKQTSTRTTLFSGPAHLDRLLQFNDNLFISNGQYRISDC
jgi:hypothetical protein